MTTYRGSITPGVGTTTALTASDVTIVPFGNIASSDVQSAIYELDTEKVAVAGDTMTGDLTVPNLITAGTVDGRDVSADGAILDTLDSAAAKTADNETITGTWTFTATGQTIDDGNARWNLQNSAYSATNIGWKYDLLNYDGDHSFRIRAFNTTPGVNHQWTFKADASTTFPGALDLSGNLTLTGTVDGRDVATDGTKLDGIESGATADQTAGEIEAIVNHDNLLGFVANEHIDWTSTTSNFSTSGTAATGALGVTGNITVTGTVDGRDIAADGATLDGLASLPLNYISGLLTSNNSTDALHDIDIATGICRDSTDTYSLELTSAFTKQLDATWAVGTAAGGLFSGSIAANTWYHVFIIRKDSDGSIDAGFDTSVSAANIPTGYTYYRRIGSVLTDGSSQILAFTTFELAGSAVETLLDAPVSESVTTGNTTGELLTITVPLGIKTRAIVNYLLSYSGTMIGWVKSPDLPNTTPTANTDYDVAVSTGASQVSVVKFVRTNTSSQVRHRETTSSGSYSLATQGWIDERVS